jgi:hypothetical protein
MYPHERSLVQRFEDKPFALLGINSDGDREALKKTLEEEKITWRSWWDGGGTSGPIATHGPIATQWNVTVWPTLYVLDGKGVIRYKSVRGPGLDKAVDTLLAEIEQGK